MNNRESIIAKSVQLRQRLGEDTNSPIDIVTLVESIENITLVYYPMGNNISGMCIKQKDSFVIAINSAMSVGRQRFSLAHELYHVYYDDSMMAICARAIGGEQEIEQEANLFASYFLMPVGALEAKAEEYAKRNPDNKLTLYDIIRIEQYFGVSHKAAVIRLKDNENMVPGRFDEYYHSPVLRLAEAMGYNSKLYRPLPENQKYGTYGYYIHQAEQLLQKELISEGKYEELLLDAFRTDLVYGDEEDGEVFD